MTVLYLITLVVAGVFAFGVACGCFCTCQYENDNFDRADSTDIGSGWNQAAGSWSIASNKLSTSSSNAVARCETPQPNGTSNVSIGVTVTGTSGDRIRLILDYQERVNAEWAKILKRNDAQRQKATVATTPTSSTSNAKEEPTPQGVRQFTGGEMAYFTDRVELCGVDICSGRRCGTRRLILDSLKKKGADGTFAGYGCEELAELAQPKLNPGTIIGAVRDLRADIVKRLRKQANIDCGRLDVILSGDSGYKFSECVTIRDDVPVAATEITDTVEPSDVRNDDVPNVPDDAAAVRRAWILKRLKDGDRLQAPAVAKQFSCSLKTAQRDLQSLKDEQRIEFVGAPRTGYYRLLEA